MATGYVQSWQSVTVAPGASGTGPTTGDQYGQKEPNIYWAEQVKGGVHMTQFLANERTQINASTQAQTGPNAQNTMWKSAVATIKANDNALLTQNPSAKQLPGALLSGNPITPAGATQFPFAYQAPNATNPQANAGVWIDGADKLSGAERAV